MSTQQKSSREKEFNLYYYTVLWTALLFLAVPIAYLYVGEDIFHDLYLILISPSKLVTDYFSLGGLGASFLNAGICGLFCNLAFKIFKVKVSSIVLAGYFLVIAHCFYGLNILNMFPPFMGVILFCIITKKKVKDNIHIAMFSTSLAPFISDFLFRYTSPSTFVFGAPTITIGGIVLAIIFSILSGFIVPALIPGTTKMYRGYNLFKAGLAIGLFGVLVYALFYSTLGIETPDVVLRDNLIYKANGNSYMLFVNLFFILVFIITLIVGFIGNNKSFTGYGKLLKCDGWNDDFYSKFGVNLTYINIGIYGLSILVFLNLVFFLAKGIGFTGPTTGIIIAAITFSACGQTIKNIWPIALGYVIIITVMAIVSTIFSLPISWETSSQIYINSFAFATGLCPFAGRYGFKVGTIAGILCAILCMVTLSMHGGFVLYNGGLTAGLTAMILLPILDYFGIKPKDENLENL